MFATPMPSAEQIDWLYRNCYDYSWFTRRRLLKRLQARHRYQRLKKLCPDVFRTKSRLLDVGCGHGWLLEAAQADGWQAEGLDLLSDNHKRSGAMKIHHGSVTDHSLSKSSYQLVTLWHMLEHTTDPRRALASVVELLAPGGYCVIAVPNLESAGFGSAGRHWVWCQQPFAHPWHFTGHCLKSILPPELAPVLVTSRDTWDAQWLETTLPFRAMMRLLREFEKMAVKAATALRWPKLRKGVDTTRFISEEALRLCSYTIYVVLRPFLFRNYEASLGGSELMIIARRQASAVSLPVEGS